MKKFLSVIMLILLLSGCNQALTVTEVDLKNPTKKTENLIEGVANENGNYLIISEDQQQYVFLNRINVIQEDEAVVLSGFTFDVQENVLNLGFTEATTSDLSSKQLNYQMLYKIIGKGDYDTVHLKKEGKIIPFDSIVGK